MFTKSAPRGDLQLWATLSGYAVPVAVMGLLLVLSHGIVDHWYARSGITPFDAAKVSLGLVFLGCSWLLWRHDKTKLWSRALSAGILFLLYASLDGPHTLGDFWARGLFHDKTIEVHQSSILAHGVYFLASFVHLPGQWVPPIAGALTAFVFFKILDRLHQDGTIASFAGLALYAGAGYHVVFLYDYIEITCVSVPALMMFFYLAISYLDSKENGYDGRRLIPAALLLGLAGTIHGMNSFLLPLLPLMIAIRRGPSRQWNVAAKELTVGVLAIALLVLSSVGALTILGYDVIPGDIDGGGDDTFFVPFDRPPQGKYERFTAFSYEHFLEVANMAGAAFPLAWLLPFLAAGLPKYRASVVKPFAMLTSLGTLGLFGYMFLFNFDWGYPRDLDLMLAMSAPLILFAIPLLIATVRRTWILLSLALLQIAASWAYIGSYLD